MSVIDGSSSFEALRMKMFTCLRICFLSENNGGIIQESGKLFEIQTIAGLDVEKEQKGLMPQIDFTIPSKGPS